MAEQTSAFADETNAPVKVFILAGQSNMQGKGFPEPLIWQLGQPEYRERYRHFVKDGDIDAFVRHAEEVAATEAPVDHATFPWQIRRDVWIQYGERHGNLTFGYGTPEKAFGPEFNFGHVLGNYYEEPVLLIKCAWGGRALAKGFLPPSAMPTDKQFELLAEDLNQKNSVWNTSQAERIASQNAKLKKENQQQGTNKPLRKFKPRGEVTVAELRQAYGQDYRQMVDDVRRCLLQLEQLFPEYRGQGYDVAGLVWFQGWNDQYNEFWLSYEDNLACFIRDIRNELAEPHLPIVIGQMGHGGLLEPGEPESPRDAIKRAQAAVAAYDEFQGDVTCVATAPFWDLEAHAIYTSPGGWKENLEQWRQFGNDRPYHYHGSPWFFAQVGTAFGEAMVELLERQ